MLHYNFSFTVNYRTIKCICFILKKPKDAPYKKCGKNLKIEDPCERCPDNNCHFYSYFDSGNKRNASLMYDPRVEGVSIFRSIPILWQNYSCIRTKYDTALNSKHLTLEKKD